MQDNANDNASARFHVDRRFTTLILLAGRDVDVVRLGSNPPDLWIAGGELIEKSLLVKGNVTVLQTITGNIVSDSIQVDLLGELVPGSNIGIDVVSDLHVLPGKVISVGTIEAPPASDLTLSAQTGRVLIKGDGLDLQCTTLYNVGNIVNTAACPDLTLAGNLLVANLAAGNLTVAHLRGNTQIFIDSNVLVTQNFRIGSGAQITLDSGANEIVNGNIIIHAPTGKLILEDGNIYFANSACGVNFSVFAHADSGNMFYSAGNCELTSFEIGAEGSVLTVAASGTPQWSLPPTGYILPVLPAQGGTGIESYADGDLIYASGPTTLDRLAIGTSGQFLMVSGGTVPAWITPFFGPTAGGTGLSTYTTGDILYASASNVLASRAIGVSGQVLTVNAGIPSWQTPLITAIPVTAPQGGTGQTAYATGDLLYASNSSTLARKAIGTSGQILSVVGGLPSWGPIPLVTTNVGGTGLTSYVTGDMLYASASNVLSSLPSGANGDVLTISAGLPSWQPGVSYPIAPTLGGTGLTAYTTGELLYASASNTLATLPIGTAGYVLTVNGSNAPQWMPSGGVTYPITATQGGTGQTTYTTGELLYASATNTLSSLSAGATNQVLTIVGGLPTWQTPAITSLPIASTLGGTGLETYSTGDVLYASAANVLAKLPIGTAGQVMTVAAGSGIAWVSGVTMGGDISGQSTAATVNNIAGQPAKTYVENTVGCNFALASAPFRTTYNQSFTVAPSATQNLVSLATYDSFSYFGFVLEAWITCRSATTPTSTAYPYGAWRWEMAWASPLVVGWNGSQTVSTQNNCSTQMNVGNTILQGVNTSGFSCIFYVTWTVYGL